jgi:hypothetical protein
MVSRKKNDIFSDIVVTKKMGTRGSFPVGKAAEASS